MEPGSALFTLGCKSPATQFDILFGSDLIHDVMYRDSPSLYLATYHGAGENKCDKTDPLALRTLFAVFG
jgi:hypothetical protein